LKTGTETVMKQKRVYWLYFLGGNTTKDEVFLYGLSLPTSFPESRNSKPKKICRVGDKHIYLFSSIQCIDIGDIQDQKKIIFNRINSHINSELTYFGTKELIQVSNHCTHDIPESPIGSTVSMHVFYSNDFYDYENKKFLDENGLGELDTILHALEKDTGQSFVGAYAKRLGCFEYGHAKKWAEEPIPFQIRPDKNKQNKYYFYRTFCDEDIFVHLVVYSRSDEILLDEFKPIGKGIKKIGFSKALSGDGGCEFWVFNKNGDLLHKDKYYWLLGINFQMSLAGETTVINDSISVKEPALAKVTSITPMDTTEISYSKDEAYDLIYNREKIIQALRKKQKTEKHERQGKWFSRSDNAISDIVAYIYKQIKAQNTELLIIDPFISKESISPLLRLGHTTVQINIISCWGAQDPDTCQASNIEKTKKDTVEFLKNLEGIALPAARLVWHDLKESLFHDRLFVIKTSTRNDDRKIFLLSNSINNLLKKYDFCIVELEGPAGNKGLAYIDTLMAECSPENRIYPEATRAN
jgi:hypothetical protein